MSDTDTESSADVPARDAIELRDYERKQLVEYLPHIIDLYESRNLEDDDRNLVERLTEMYEELDAPIDGTEARYEFGGDNWRDLALALDELDKMRASWLSAKIGRRAQLTVVQMGFTSSIPFMSMVTGETPVRPD